MSEIKQKVAQTTQDAHDACIKQLNDVLGMNTDFSMLMPVDSGCHSVLYGMGGQGYVGSESRPYHNMPTALHLRQKSIISSGPASACARAVGAPHTDSQCLPVSELLIISTLATAKPRSEAEAEAEADSKHFDTNGAFYHNGNLVNN